MEYNYYAIKVWQSNLSSSLSWQKNGVNSEC